MTDTPPQPVVSRYALPFIFITMLLDSIGLGIIIPVAPKIIAQLTHQDMSGAARWGGWLFFVFALMQFLCAPLVGNLSDRFGRRPVLIVSILMLGFDYVITAIAPTIFWLFVSRILSGIAGASYTTAYAYIADISPPEKRSARMGLIGMAFGLGFIFGPAIGQFALSGFSLGGFNLWGIHVPTIFHFGGFGKQGPGWVAACFCAAN